MKMLRAWLLRFGGLFARQRRDHDLAAELDSHLQLHIEDNLRAGMKPEEARRQALIKLGGVEQTKEKYGERRGLPWLESFLQDVRFGVRILLKNPGFTAVAVLTLALGIGVNVAIFSVFDSFLFRLLPVQNPAQLTTVSSIQKGGGESLAFSYPEFEDIRNQTRAVFSDVSAITEQQSDGISVNGKNEPILTSYVAGNYFSMLGIQPVRGRLVLPSEGKVAGGDPVLVLGYSYWLGAFGSDANVLGKRVAIDGLPVTIVGVTQEGFHGIRSFMDVQAYLPLGMAASNSGTKNIMADRAAQRFELIARLRTGINLRQAQGSLDVVARRLSEQYPTTDEWASLRLREMGPLGRGPISGRESPCR